MSARVGLLALIVAAACGGRMPETRYYRLVAPQVVERNASGPILAIEELAVDPAYDDPRMAYRESPHRVDYYEYHQWAADPGPLVSGFLRDAYDATGRFQRVTADHDPAATLLLGGRVLAIGEVDVTSRRWTAEIELELSLRDARTGDTLWSGRVRESEPVRARTPEALAAAVSRALARVVARTTPEILAHPPRPHLAS
jgi:ABC-type uncharacterized transport system auxiliary subunit